jgi:hypothetical protein
MKPVNRFPTNGNVHNNSIVFAKISAQANLLYKLMTFSLNKGPMNLF